MFSTAETAKKQTAKAGVFCILFLAVWFFLILPGSLSAGDPQRGVVTALADSRSSQDPIADIWDASRYISIDEVAPGMEAYCLTDYGDGGIERFRLVVLDVIRNIEPGRDAILVRGLDERFIHTGPVGGCSGSPVYIKNRLAGALAFAWTFSKDPLYGVTPIAEMLRVGRQTRPGSSKVGRLGFAFDFSKPIDVCEIYKQITTSRLSSGDNLTGAAALPCPLVVSGIPAGAFEQLRSSFESLGFMPVQGISGTAGKKKDYTQLVPGAALVVPLLAGDMEISVLGTATEVRDDKVYGFGHSFLGYGAVDLPMATGEVYTVVSSIARSFKLGNARKIVGALTTDEATAVFGRIGAQPKMIPLTIRVDRYNDTQPRVYNCQVSSNKSLTPGLVQAALAGAVYQLGALPPDHTLEYSVAIGTKTGDLIRFQNVSTTLALNELIPESISSIALLMNNPYKEADIQSMQFDLRITPKNMISHIWSVDLSAPKVKAGHEISVEVVVESFLSEKTKYQVTFKVPEDLAPGNYGLTVCGPYEYERFLRKAVPYRFMADNYSSLVQALNDALNIERGKLHCLLTLPPGGVTLEKAELPDLPATKTLVLHSPKRALRIQPYPHWIEKTVETGTVIIDREAVNITVED